MYYYNDFNIICIHVLYVIRIIILMIYNNNNNNNKYDNEVNKMYEYIEILCLNKK